MNSQNFGASGTQMNAHVVPARAPQTIGLQFVEKYYSILHSKPRYLYRFYTDASTLTHGDFKPPFEATSDTVTGQDGIHAKIMELGFEDTTTQVYSVDSQYSWGGGVLVLVTGALGCKGKPKRSFVQAFFLAVQENGYFVLNDVFRYLPEPQVMSYVPMENGAPVVLKEFHTEAQPTPPAPPPPVATVTIAPAPPAPAPVVPPPKPVQPPVEVPLEKPVVETASEPVKLVAETQPKPVVAPAERPPAHQPQVPLTYAERLKLSTQSIKAGGATSSAPVLSAPAVVASQPAKPPIQTVPSPPQDGKSTPVLSEGDTDGPPQDELISSSIVIKDLPPDITKDKLEQVFSRFGSIKRNGITLKLLKGKDSYAYLDFESQKSAEEAIHGNVEVDGHSVIVEGKKAYVVRGGYRGGRGGPPRGGFGGRGRGRAPSRGFNDRVVDGGRGRGGRGMTGPGGRGARGDRGRGPGGRDGGRSRPPVPL